MAEPIHVTDDSFSADVLESDVPVVVDFWAEWCVPCKQIAPIVDDIANEYEGRAKAAKMNVDTDQSIAASFGIRSIPALLYFKNGELVDQLIGTAPKKAVLEKLDALL
jgi:thioredoxin 1